ncbi:MAG: energy transducer TonB [Verrucomicrobia bacterium]|nr:energy transducer TonB [Verrucomicrobiota bacterium]
MKLPRFRVSERQVLHFIMVSCIIGFAVAFLMVFQRRHVMQTDIPKRPFVRWISPRLTESRDDLRTIVAELDDPSLMSLPSPRAFSAALWQHQVRLDDHLIQPSNSLAYLDAKPLREPDPLLPSASLADAVRAAAEKPKAHFVEPAPATTVTMPGASSIHFDEALAACRLLHAPSLPIIASETALRATVVRLALAADGSVLHVVLDRTCGNENADAVALDAARRLRFELPAGHGQQRSLWGTARFLWATKMP